jgi:hypothetical protein
MQRPAGPVESGVKKYQPTDTGIVPTNINITAPPVWQDVRRYCRTQRHGVE